MIRFRENVSLNLLLAIAAWLSVAIGALAAGPLDSGITRRHVEDRTYLSYATESLDNLITYGTDRYGTVQSSLLVSNLDVRTKENPVASEFGAADEVWRVERRERRAPGGSNFLHNQSVYQAMERASQVTGDSHYADFVDGNFDWALTNLVDSNNLFWWGYHRHYDVHADTMEAEPGAPHHEMHFVDVPLWEQMWDRNPTAVRNEIEAIWDRHVVDKNSGQINRHDQPGGLSFITSSASFINAFAFLSSKLSGNDQVLWRNRARLLANYNWNSRNPDTNLLPHTPNETSRWDGFRSATTTPGVYVPALMRAYEFTGDTTFRTQALTYLKGWAQYAYDPASGSFWGSLQLDGTPVPGPWAPSGYEQYEPRGLVDLWAPEFITAQYTPDAAKEYAIAYQQLGDPALLDTAEKWATLIRKNLPATQTLDGTWYQGYSDQWAQYGTYAEHYGYLIEFFVTLFDETGKSDYLLSARDLAKEAVSTLWYEGLFRGHPDKPYYEAIDGEGILIESLIDLDSHKASFTKFGDFNGDNVVNLDDYSYLTNHWLSAVTPYTDGDVNGDGVVSLLDFSRFKNEYFEGPASALQAPSKVPEPSGLNLTILCVGCSCVFAQCRMRSRRRSVFCRIMGSKRGLAALLLTELFLCSAFAVPQIAEAQTGDGGGSRSSGLATSSSLTPLDGGITRRQVEGRSYMSYTTEVLDNLMTYGTDRYGSVQSNLLVTILDVRTKSTSIPEYGDTYWRADTRYDRRSPEGANFLQSQPLLRTMYLVSNVTGDNMYANFADSNIDYATTHLVDSNGMFQWGWHRWYDVVTDQFMNDGDYHEMHFVTMPEWERMWARNPAAVQTEIEQIWNRHVIDKTTGQVNRHDHDGPGVGFIMSSASFIEATAFLSTKLPGTIPGERDPSIDTWLERSKRLANYDWDRRNPLTNLVAHIPDQSNFDREDEFVAFTSMHLLSLGLMKAYEHTGDTLFRDQAMAYLTAYDKYGYDPVAKTYWGTLNLDGTPDMSPRSGPLVAFPTGHIDFWQPNVIDREFPPEAAQAYAEAFALTGDPTMRTAADRWAAVIRSTQAEKKTLDVSIYSEYSKTWAPLGTYAEHYGRVIDFFLTMFDETGEDHYLFSARDTAKDAVSSLFFEGLFRGHPNKPYYEELDGVPLLLEALAELDQYSASFKRFADFDNDNDVDLTDYQTLTDHWLQTVLPYEDGDVTGDGIVNLLDFNRFKNEYFEGAASALSMPGAVPEPPTAALLIIPLAIVGPPLSRMPRANLLMLLSSSVSAAIEHEHQSSLLRRTTRANNWN